MGLNLKKYGLDKIMLIVLAGVLLIIIAMPQRTDYAESTESMEDNSNTNELEERLIRILERTYGEGTIDVMITTGTGENTYFDEEEDDIEGVLVVARCADDSRAVYDIVTAVTTLFDVPEHKVKILKMN